LDLLGTQSGEEIQRLKKTLDTFIPLAERVIDQTQRRVFNKGTVLAQEKIVSIFEPRSDIIVRGKETRLVEYGHKIWHNEVDEGIVNHYRILDGNPYNELQWEPTYRLIDLACDCT
jgi:IS5 family transposase